MPDVLRIYLPVGPRNRAEAGKHELVNRLVDLMSSLGIGTELRPVSLEERVASLLRPEYGIILMEEPWHANMLTMRRAYLHPFWRIETGPERWHFEVAQRRFDPSALEGDAAATYVKALRDRVFGPEARTGRSDGFILVPLQGYLSTQRSFQTASPIEMLEATLKHAAGRRVIMTLHPNEVYPDHELAALERLMDAFPNLETGGHPTQSYLPSCAYVVTQNSAIAFLGFLMHKPAILFGRSDFHHIAANVRDLGVEAAFETVEGDLPDFDRYVAWFLRDNSINAARMESTKRLHAVLRRRGWDI